MTSSQAAGIDLELLELIYDIPLRAAKRPDRLPLNPSLPGPSTVPSTGAAASNPTRGTPTTAVSGMPMQRRAAGSSSTGRSGDTQPPVVASAESGADWACDWAPVMERLRASLHTDGSLLMTAGADMVEKLDFQGYDDSAWQDYAGHFHSLDPCLLALSAKRLPLGRVYSVDDLVPRATLVRGAYYNDFWRPYDVGHDAGAFCVDAGSGIHLHLALLRSARAGCYQAGELALLGVYISHIFRALRLQAALAPAVEPDLDAFARRYRLTPAEVRLLETLRHAGTLPAAAARLGRRHNTLRAQLRTVFAKTDTHSQVALMTLLHRG